MRRDATDIIAPRLPGGLVDRQASLTRVTAQSALPLRRAVFQCARYFRHEMRYDFIQYGQDGRETDPDHVAFLWPDPQALRFAGNDDVLVPAVGAGCFRWRQWQDAPHGWALQWLWLHPYQRRQGLLTAAWPAFRDEFGDFVCEPPLSDAMKGFLAKRGECWHCGRHCRCEKGSG
jgi:hypothetical protein